MVFAVVSPKLWNGKDANWNEQHEKVNEMKECDVGAHVNAIKVCSHPIHFNWVAHCSKCKLSLICLIIQRSRVKPHYCFPKMVNVMNILTHGRLFQWWHTVAEWARFFESGKLQHSTHDAINSSLCSSCSVAMISNSVRPSKGVLITKFDDAHHAINSFRVKQTTTPELCFSVGIFTYYFRNRNCLLGRTKVKLAADALLMPDHWRSKHDSVCLYCSIGIHLCVRVPIIASLNCRDRPPIACFDGIRSIENQFSVDMK